MSALRSALLPLVCLMLFATSASAECAWVLWVLEARADTTAPWKVIAAAETYKDCMKTAQNAADLQLAGIRVSFDNGGVNAILKTSTILYWCVGGGRGLNPQ